MLYQAARAGEPDPLPPLGVQYTDFAVWQRAWLTGEVLEGQLDYWRGQLAGAPVLDLPADRARPPVRSTAGAIASFAVPAEVAGGLREVARQGGASMFMTVLAGFMVLLARYTGLDDVVVGTPVANRDRSEIEDLIGFFVNTLVLRADLSGDPSFTGLLGRVRAVALGAYARQDLPFEQVVDELVAERDRSRTPLFQVMFSYAADDRGRGGRGGAGRGARADDRPAGEAGVPRAALCDLTLTVADAGRGGLAGGIEYSTELFDRATVRRMAGHLGVLLGAVAGDAGAVLSGLPVLTAGEREQVLAGWNQAAVPVPAAGGVGELIAGRAAACPDAAAVVCGGAVWTYGALMGRAGRLAWFLRELGAGPESVVGLCLERGAEMVAGVLAVWLAGAAYLPLDPAYPAGRLGFMLADSGASVLVGRRAVAGALAGSAVAGRGVRVVWLDDAATVAGIGRCPAVPPDADARGAGLAAVIYTSGTTGRPKGTLVTRGGLAAVFAGWAAAHFGAGGGGYRWLSSASVSFDVFTGDVVRALCSGGTLVLGGATVVLSVAEWAGLLAAEGVGALECAPRYADELVSYLTGAGGTLAGLRLVVVTTDVWRSGAAARARAVLGAGVRVLTAYGVTEATIDSTCGMVPAGAGGVDGPVPVGGPLPGTRVYVLDRRLGPVPAGVAGELFIGGAQVARGYHGRAALTAERFVADPFGAGGERLYRTGDRARWRADGQIEFLGRADEQVKVRGFRVEPGEVEAALAAHPAIAAAVVAVFGEQDQARLAAWLIPASPAAGIPAAGELRAFLSGRLPEFMIPAAYTELAALPLTPNGKIDRAALPAPDAARPDVGGYLAPATPAQELLAGIWAQVLGIDRAGAGDDFFALGGHSLLATRVISRVREVFGTEVPLAALFDHPTVTGLAAIIEGSGTGVALPPVERVSREERLPLSFAQQRLWFLAQLEPGSAEYNVPVPAALGEADVAALGAALGAITRRHEVLRTRLMAEPDGVPYQVIDPPSPFRLPVADVSGAADPRRAAESLLAADAVAPFDLAAGPVIRACLARLAADEHLLVLSVHHVVFDEWSAGIFRRELTESYESFRAGEPDRLAPPPVQYADFAAWQRQWLAGEVLDGQLAYWRGQLAGLPVLELPADRPRPPVRPSEGEVVRFSVPAEVTRRLRAVAQQGGATMFMTVLAAFMMLLARYCGQDDIVVGAPVANRDRSEIEGLIGCFFNTLVLRADLSGDPTFAELLGRVRAMALDAYAHQDLPFEQLVGELVTERDRSRNPLFQVMFLYDTDPITSNASGSDDGADAHAWVPVRCDVELSVGVGTDGDLTGSLRFSPALFDAARIERLAGYLGVVLGSVAGNAGTRVSGVPVVPAGERELLVQEWNATAAGMAAGGVVELIVARAERYPDAVAVMSGDACVSFGGLVGRAERLAGVLQGLGAGPESVVAVCLGRGVNLLAGLLGVWLAGAAYLPLDPGYPAGRLEFMLADSGARVLVGDRDAAAGLLADGGLPDGVAGVWLDDPAGPGAASAAAAVPAAAVARGLAAYVIYTSGSTGRPKGVVVGQRNLLNLLVSMSRVPGLGEADVLLGVTTAAFDMAGPDLWLPLVTGARLVVAGDGVARSPGSLAGEITRQGVTALQATPTTWRMLVDDGWAGSPRLRALCGAEALPPGLAGHVLARTEELWNMYGPTETTIWSSRQQVHRRSGCDAGPPDVQYADVCGGPVPEPGSSGCAR